MDSLNIITEIIGGKYETLQDSGSRSGANLHSRRASENSLRDRRAIRSNQPGEERTRECLTF